MSYFDTQKLRKRANEKFRKDLIEIGNYDEEVVQDYELTDKEFNNLYILHNVKYYYLFDDFLKDITFTTSDMIDEMFDIDYQAWEIFDATEILEYLMHEERVIEGFIELDYRELYVIIGEW